MDRPFIQTVKPSYRRGLEARGEYLTHKSIILGVKSQVNNRQVKCLGILVCFISLENGDQPTLRSARLMASRAALGRLCLSLLGVLERSFLDLFNLSPDK